MKDRFGRDIKSLRISVNCECNLRCFYCHKEGHKSSERYLTPEDFEKIVKTAMKFGIEKVKISGGEPLLREDIVEIVRRIKNLGIKDLSLTTNGTLLKDLAYELKEAGLDRINISLFSLNKERFGKFIGGNLDDVIEGIRIATKLFYPVKINYVVTTVNIDEFNEMLKFCKEVKAILQVIELIPTTEPLKKFYYSINTLEEKIKERANKVFVRKFQNRKKYFLDGLEVEFVKPMDNTEFCANCSRIRVTHDGHLKPCLLRDDNLIDIYNALKKNEDLEKYFLECIYRREPYFRKK
ncbi:molybdenum cofactor biosynthesis protein A [Methanocaldococcus infernus ME]|uniref:Probable GTP 3',8-cyclase n=1 Tax=Methanocaldococcus infernus (strain DSM 11812 / JCM 15783 / ME) TaxID=573063 RepID=D5VRV7_METIM|nr:GTP 3',8-cyclase MoaA [Methanocaldococcus infernus]ADG13310.1 molybdenum cofactor biosynthesis protein A [Methanocaldococcus infernus ME]